MDETLHELLGDIASSLRRIAVALEEISGSGPSPQASKENDARLRAHQSHGAGEPPTRGEPSSATQRPSRIKQDMEPDTDGNPSASDRRDILRGFLAKRGIQIKTERQPDEADEVLDRLAFFMGSRFPQVRLFYRRLKGTLSNGRTFSLDLKDEPQEVVSNTCQLATELHRIAFLEEYKYVKSPRYELHARPSRLPTAINFLSGGWLERYGLLQAVKAATACGRGVRYSYLRNTQVVLPNGDDFELDVLFEVEGNIYWMELKTGDYQRHIAKYSKIGRILGLERDRCFMVLTDIPATSANELSALFRMTVVSVEELGTILTRTIAAHLRAPPPS